jgi:hypothetical protein
MDMIQCQFNPLTPFSNSSSLYDSHYIFLLFSFLFQVTFFNLKIQIIQSLFSSMEKYKLYVPEIGR